MQGEKIKVKKMTGARSGKRRAAAAGRR